MKPAMKAWIRSLPLVLSGPILMWLAFGATAPTWDKTGATFGQLLTLSLLAGIVGAVVHLVFYIGFGIPMFNHAFKYPHLPAWKPLPAVGIGAASGFLAIFFLGFVANSGNFSSIAPVALIPGPVYGAWTAWCARRLNPNP